VAQCEVRHQEKLMNRTIIYAAIIALCAFLYGSMRQHLPGGIEYEYAHAQEAEGEPEGTVEGEPIEMMIRNVGASVKCINFRIPADINPEHVGPTAKIRLNYQILDEYGDPAGEWRWCREYVGVKAGECVQFRGVKCNVPDGTSVCFWGFMVSPNGSRSQPALAVWTDNLDSVAVCEFDTTLPPPIIAEVEE